MKCWEFQKCGREAGGLMSAELGVCPAYPSHGHECAHIAGTLCGGSVTGTLAQKIDTCLTCGFYRSPDYERDLHDLLRLVAVVEQAAEAIALTDLVGKVQFINPAFTAITGFAQTEAIGCNIQSLLFAAENAALLESIGKQIRAGEPWHGRLPVTHKEGSLVHVECTVSPVREASGTIMNFVCVIRDVTRLVDLERQLRQAQKLEAVGSLAAGIAHEINTPMQFIGDNVQFLLVAYERINAFIAATQTLLDNEDPDAVWDKLDLCRAALTEHEVTYMASEVPIAIQQTLQGIDRVTSIVKAMKRFAHADSTEMTHVDVNDALLTTLTVARNETKYVATIETKLAQDLPLVPCYPGEMNQVYLNLLVNAADAIREAVGDSGSKGVITVSTILAGESVCITVADSGNGIPEEIQQHIFEPFFTTKPTGVGSGQGLSLAYRTVVERHGGTLTFTTSSGRGTTFQITLPLKAQGEVAT